MLKHKLHLTFKCIFAVLVLLVYSGAYSQTPLPPPARAKFIEVDLFNQEVKGKVPYDFPFVFVGTPTEKIDKLEFSYREVNGPANYKDISTWERLDRPVGDPKTEKFYLIFSESFLEPNRDYEFKIIGYKANGSKYIESKFIVYTESSLSDHIKLDFGVGYAYKPKALIGLTSVHFYFTPLNDDTDLGSVDLNARRHVLLRTSLFIGVSPITFFSNTEQEIQKRFALGNLAYGVGIRSPFYGEHFNTGRFGRIFLQPMRLNLGVLNFAQDDENPLISKNRFKNAFFTSVTYDFNVSTILGPVGKLLQ